MYTPDLFKHSVLTAATQGTEPHLPLRIRGNDMDELANELTAVIDTGCHIQDHSDLMVLDRGFGLYVLHIPHVISA